MESLPPATPEVLAASLVALHADLHPERAQIRTLLASGVAPHTILNLYPLDLDENYRALEARFANRHVRERFMRTLYTQFRLLDPNHIGAWRKWLSELSPQQGNALYAVYQPASERIWARRAVNQLLCEADQDVRAERGKIEGRLRAMHVRMLLAERWVEYPNLRGLERDLISDLGGMRYCLCL